MNAITPMPTGRTETLKPVAIDPDNRFSLCVVEIETESHWYQVNLDADISYISLEGMNQFLVTVIRKARENGKVDKFYAELKINLRRELSNIAIAGGNRHYFSVTGRSLDLKDTQIDSSIHEAVDLGLMDFRMRSEARHSASERKTSILFDSDACNLLKASISALLAQATLSHRHVIAHAGHIFASRQDYVRQMCTTMRSQSEALADSIYGKACCCEAGIF